MVRTLDRVGLIAILLLWLVTTVSAAQAAKSPEDSFASLRSKVEELKVFDTPEKRVMYAEITKNLTACEQGAGIRDGENLAQYIYNDVYEWSVLPTTNGFCVHLFQPFQRPLSVDEASDLLVGSRMEFPVDVSPVPSSAKIAEPRMGRGFGKEVK